MIEPEPAQLAGTAVAVLLLGLAAGPIGAIGGLLAGVAWIVGAAGYGVTVGVLAVWVAGGALTDPVTVVGVFVGLGAIVAIDARRGDESGFGARSVVGCSLLVVGGFVVGAAVGGLPGAIVGVIGTSLAAGYLFHRIGVVMTRPTEDRHGN